MKNRGLFFIKMFVLFFISQILISCMGQGSDPLTKYKDLKSTVPTGEVSETQSLAPDVFTAATSLSLTEIIDFKLQGTNEVNNANYLEGQNGILYFKILPKSSKIIKYHVQLTDFPNSSRPEIKTTSNPQVLGLHWTPPMGIIPPGENYILLKAEIKTTVLEASDTNLNGLTKVDLLNIIVSRDNYVPKILGLSDLKSGIEEGKTIEFTVDIEDPRSDISPKIPEIQITPYIYSNTEAFSADGARLVNLDPRKSINPAKIADQKNHWRFYFLIQADQLPLDRDRRGIENPNSPSVNLCFHVRAISVIGTQSVQQRVCLKGRYSAQLPTIKWADDTPKEIKSGETVTLKFDLNSENGLGVLSLKNAVQQISSLGGKKDLQCNKFDATTSLQNCQLTWTPVCQRTASTKKLKLKVENKVGNKTKTQTFEREFSLLANEELCPAPVKQPVKQQKNKSKKAGAQ